ncbi:nicotinate-nucleotide adenylyltransferase [Halomonas sp. MCCC 1A17488]|uniref:Probable nicotinate-nucleotide adenylyltransferase n=1 Tax=Billgrantia sulfidoxydans TaxID=2733484 RepID=A0ABX7W9T5_9GAMM|nr:MULTISPECIES: nicotinate-nucleotide adenylyltransferase [Halomonas]MCE8014686.1 nicotinate-nucleotide adenylyltransferase [Halomonas sp. MCCC 1A17488]MCG3238019.1 nicotinate-nucleotide adenylyltransferase [Halomonas sp. MCCC 1A17488]QPP51632.1 nicotinate-nucleotide adenylyltransferase [Halomonas sp. SS10-MC5]QTP57109.1 nicotinate-nucleotide adenylyltransferase [Halomonas sulfidoxydans]
MLGGTFDPVHLGHLRSAVELLEALGLDRVHMVPAKIPPLRGAPQVTPEERLALLRLGIGETPGLVADPRELERDGPSYSADTLASLRGEYGNQARLVMALGHDAFLRLADWQSPRRLFELAHLVVIDRPGHDAPLPSALAELIRGREVASAEALMRRPAGHLLRLALPTRMAISATEIRRRLASERSVRYLLPEAVEARILANLLYRRR